MKLSRYNPEGMQIATGCDMQLGAAFLVSESHILVQKKEGKIDDSNVATTMTYGVASSLSWSKIISNSKTGIIRMRGASKTFASFER